MVALRMSLYFSSKGSVRPCAAMARSLSYSVSPSGGNQVWISCCRL